METRRSEDDLPQSMVLESDGRLEREAARDRVARAPALPSRRAPALDALVTAAPTLRESSSIRRLESAVASTIAFEAVIGGTDDRTAVADPRRPPFRRICALRMRPRFGNDVLVGTGWLIGRQTIATAGHCVFDPDRGGWMRGIEILPGLAGTRAPLRLTSTRFRAPAAWTDHEDSEADFGVIQLDRPIGDALGWFGLAALGDRELIALPQLTVTGYPLDLGGATHQYQHSRKVLAVRKHRIEYDIDTYGGQSGAPVWTEIGGRVFAVGIHTVGGYTQNAGTRISDDVLDQLVQWSREFDMVQSGPPVEMS